VITCAECKVNRERFGALGELGSQRYSYGVRYSLLSFERLNLHAKFVARGYVVKPSFHNAMMFCPLRHRFKGGAQVAGRTKWDEPQRSRYRLVDTSGDFLRYRMVSRGGRGPNGLVVMF
jgi:hypothetical protein